VSLRFESFLLNLSAAFAVVRAEGVEREIDEWLGKLAAFIKVDRSSLWECDRDGSTLYRRHIFITPALDPPPLDISRQNFPWLTEQFQLGNVVAWARVPQDIPASAVAEREYTLRAGAKSVLCIPMRTGSTICVIAFSSVRAYHAWPDALIQRLRLVGEIFASALVRQRAEKALQASEARNRAILEALPDLMFVLSPDGVYVDYSCRDHADLQVPPEQFLGRRFDEILPRPVAEQFTVATARAANTGERVKVEYALEIRGVMRDYEALIVRSEEGALVCSVRNVTDRKQAELRLRESEERFRGAFSHSAIGLALVSLEGRWLQVNSALCRMFGYSEAELTGTTFQALTRREDLAPNLELMRRALDGEISHYELEKRYIHRDGHTITAFLTVSLVRDVHNRPLYFVSQLQDITERKQEQMEIERLRLEINHFGRLALMNQMTASLAHELLQPITAIMADAGAGRQYIDRHAAGLAEIRPILEAITESGKRAAAIIHGVRDLLRKEPREHGRVNLSRLVQDVANVMRSDLILRHIALELQLDTSPHEISGDVVQLQQVILNLSMNAADAMSACPPEDRKLTIATHAREDEVRLSVSDRGVGVAPANLKLMFDPFFTTKSEGLGLGLPICREIIRQHRGRMWAENNADRGMTMYCALPVG
jgi:PAS domain S-box-containing protein